MTSETSEFFRDKVLLAPMMIGSNRTFRRIAHRYGAQILGGEMALSGKLKKLDRRELGLVSARHEDGVFSAQIAGCNIETLCEAAKVVQGRGARILDLNAGCPMNFVIQKGGGAALLTSHRRLGRIVEALKKAVEIPVTVKIRAGFSSGKPSEAGDLAKIVEQSGADAIAVHARFRDEFYDAPADWKHIRQAVEAVSIPVIGNGDIRTYEDALRMKEETQCASVMIGRAALQRPWIFQEFLEKRAINPDPEQRWNLIDEHSRMIRETFGERKGFDTFRWHAGWYVRWHTEQKAIREGWSGLDSQEQSSWTVVLEAVRRIMLEGPEILPPPDLRHSKVEAG